ncbi:MAG: hypothetical protein DRJ10_10775 [Bacteroidetes bacterium]|nr:MAG: hypothetical protein DRJ10_10775 [Bacteroidota bacterium]
MLIFAFKIIDELYFIAGAKDQVFLKGIENLPTELKEQVLDWRQNNLPNTEHRFFSMRFLTNGSSVIIVLMISTLFRNNIVKGEKEQESSLLKNQMLEAE